MFISLLKSKIHKARITQTELHYEGSLTLDEDLMDAAGLIENEKVSVLNMNNGSRLDTYVIKGERGSGAICLNGAAARLGMTGDEVIVLSYCMLDAKEAETFRPTLVFVDDKNAVKNTGGDSNG